MRQGDEQQVAGAPASARGAGPCGAARRVIPLLAAEAELRAGMMTNRMSSAVMTNVPAAPRPMSLSLNAMLYR